MKKKGESIMGNDYKKIRRTDAQAVKKHTMLRQFLRDLNEAITGSEQDFTQGPLGRAIFMLSIPMVLEMVMESVFAITDIFWVSRIGPEAIAAVGLTESVITIVYALSIGLSMSTTAIVSRRIGEKNRPAAANAAFQAILAGFIPSVIIAIPGVIYAKDLLWLMGADRVIIDQLSGYTAVMLGSNAVIMLLFIINAIFRSAGDAAIAMRVLWISNIINIFLDPMLIFGFGPFPELGITGAAIATSIGRGTAVAYQVYMLFRGSRRIRLILGELQADLKVIKELIKLSFGTIGQNLIATASWIGLVRIISIFGSEVLAGYTIGIRVIMFALLPSWGMANAASTLVGQNLGAKQPKRAEKAVWAAGSVNIILLGIIGTLIIIFSGQITGLFTDEPDVIYAGSNCLTILSYGFMFYGAGMVLISAFNGAGDTYTPTVISFISFWLIEISLAYGFAIPAAMEENGVFYAIVIAESFMTIIAFVVFRRGRWKKVKV